MNVKISRFIQFNFGYDQTINIYVCITRFDSVIHLNLRLCDDMRDNKKRKRKYVLISLILMEKLPICQK